MMLQIPHVKRSQRGAIKEAMRIALEDRCIPLLKTIINKEIDDDNDTSIVNGYMCYTMHIIAEEVCRAMNVTGQPSNRRRPQQIQDRENELELSRRIKSKTSGERIASYLTRICALHDDQDLSDQIKANQIHELKHKIHQEGQQISNTMKDHVFLNGIIDDTSITNIVENIDQREGIIRYLSTAEDSIIAECERRRKEHSAYKVQTLYRECPKKAMQYYVDKHPSPSCTIPITQIQREFGQRWNHESGYAAPPENSEWRAIHKLTEEDKELLNASMKSRSFFKNIITTRDPQSAHGPDGIGYWTLQAMPDLSSEYMELLSKLIMKYEFMPTIWNNARTILLYKKGEANDLKNWRPLTIAPCLYRIWTCALASALQDINKSNTRLFNENQKGFIKGTDGCLEHSRTATELFNDANRKHKSIYAMAIDLRDAFGSVPHSYINEILKEMKFPENIRNIIETTYDRGYTKIRIGNQESQRIKVGQGVKQGCPLSPLIFNFCMNPLLNALERHGAGYLISGIKVGVQAYADDIILFAEDREGMERNISILEQFLQYSKLEVNCSKCHSLSYIINENNNRDYDNVPFQINGQDVHCTTLAEGIQYLGTTTAATNRIREHGTDETINEVEKLLDNIKESPLTLAQKIHAIKTFAIPKLDYILTEGKAQLKKMKALDRKIRTVIHKHIHTTVPKALYYTHWRDGGFSIQSLYERARMLRIKAFAAMYNSPNEKTKNLMREFVDSERRHRSIGIRNIGSNSHPNDRIFLNWLLPERIRKGTDTITLRAKEAADYFGITIKLIEDKVTLDIPAHLIINRRENTNDTHNRNNNNQNQDNEDESNEELDSEQEEIRDANENDNAHNNIHPNSQDQEEDHVLINEVKSISKTIMSIVRKKAQEKLTSSLATGHSFRNIMNAPYANSFIGNPSNTLNDNIAIWLIRARTNMLINGATIHSRHINLNRISNNNNQRRYCCPYCLASNEDTINHRLNGCLQNQSQKKTRHNMVQRIIYQEVVKKYGHQNTTIDRSVTINGVHINQPYSSLRPDIVTYDNNNIYLIEFSCPYDMKNEQGEETMTICYDHKKEKYAELVQACNQQFQRNTHLIVIIVSSLGAIYNKSITAMKKVLGLQGKHHNKEVKTLLRRMSLASCIGSYFIYYKINFSERNRHRGLDDEEGRGEAVVEAERNNNHNNNSHIVQRQPRQPRQQQQAEAQTRAHTRAQAQRAHNRQETESEYTEYTEDTDDSYDTEPQENEGNEGEERNDASYSSGEEENVRYAPDRMYQNNEPIMESDDYSESSDSEDNEGNEGNEGNENREEAVVREENANTNRQEDRRVRRGMTEETQAAQTTQEAQGRTGTAEEPRRQETTAITNPDTDADTNRRGTQRAAGTGNGTRMAVQMAAERRLDGITRRPLQRRDGTPRAVQNTNIT